MRSVLLAVLLGTGIGSQVSAADPPGRVGRVSFLDGSVSFRADSKDDWDAASLNYPVTTGGELWTDARARAEVHVGSSAVRLAPETLADFVEASDHTTRVRLTQGSLYLRVRQLESGDIYEVQTPEGTVSMLEGGRYRVDVSPDGTRSTLSVRDGDAEITTGGGATVSVRPGESVAVTGQNSAASAISLVAVDDWERWCAGRDHYEDQSLSLRYLSPGFVGFEALGGYGSWEIDADFGPVWVPTVSAGWAPYRFGYWSWVNPWGWTWIDQAPWGFAPFHYGRWAFRRNRWAWVPGEIVPAPVYAPALVAFLGGSGFDLSVSLGGGRVGWFPLAPGEVYVPGYRVSQTYIRNINITVVKVRDIDFRRIDMARVRYANRAVSGAVTAVPREAFLRSAAVGRAAVQVPASEIGRATVIGATAPLPSAERSPAPAGHRSVARPPAAAVGRPVIARPSRTTVHATATPSVPANPTLQRAWQTERDQALARQAAERAALERRQQEELRSPPAGVSQDELRQRQDQERQALTRRHQAETDDIDRRYHKQRTNSAS